MVQQIGYVVTGIRSTIAEIEKFSFFHLPKDYVESNVQRPKSALKQPGRQGRRKSSIKARSSDALTASFSSENPRKSVQFEVVSPIRPCREYFTKLDHMRNEKVVNMKKLFESIGPTLVKLESLILGTHTGVSAKMKQYYIFWEKELFTLLIKWTTTNMEDFGKALTKDEPIFQVDAVLTSPEIVTRPSSTEINNTIVHSVKDFLERIKSFRRWMDGTCLMCEPVMSGDEPYVFSYFEDVLQVCVSFYVSVIFHCFVFFLDSDRV